MQVPRMRTARIITSSQAVIEVARDMGVHVCIAYVDSTGYTRMLWRDRRAVPGQLLLAENAAWTSVVEHYPHIPIDAFVHKRQRSNDVNALQATRVRVVHQTGGMPLVVGNVVIGAVAVVGADLNRLAVYAYMGESHFDPTQTNHFAAYATGTMKTVEKSPDDDHSSQPETD